MTLEEYLHETVIDKAMNASLKWYRLPGARSRLKGGWKQAGSKLEAAPAKGLFLSFFHQHFGKSAGQGQLLYQQHPRDSWAHRIVRHLEKLRSRHKKLPLKKRVSLGLNSAK